MHAGIGVMAQCNRLQEQWITIKKRICHKKDHHGHKILPLNVQIYCRDIHNFALIGGLYQPIVYFWLVQFTERE